MKNLQADVVVIGTGPSGLAACVEASEAGLKVIAFEKQNVSGLRRFPAGYRRSR